MISDKTQEFLNKVFGKFPDHAEKYDYSKVQYVRTHDKVIITCKKCGDFSQSPAKHLSGRGCPSCRSMKKDEVYNLALSKGFEITGSVPLSQKDKVDLVCMTCGTTCTKQLRHLKCCKKCPTCLIEDMREDKDHFLSRLPENPNYDYTNSDYLGANKPIEVLCKKHGVFQTTPSHLYCGKGCKLCGFERLSPFNDTIAERNSEEFKNIDSGFYLLKIGDFYKIGIAKNFKARLNKLKRQVNFDVDVISYIKADQYSCIKLEQHLLKHLPILTFDINERFDGYTECFYLEEDQVSELAELIEQSLI